MLDGVKGGLFETLLFTQRSFHNKVYTFQWLLWIFHIMSLPYTNENGWDMDENGAHYPIYIVLRYASVPMHALSLTR